MAVPGAGACPLRPILIPPSFPSNLLSVMPIQELPSSSEKGPSSLTTTIKLTGLPPNTIKADLLPISQHFGEVTRVFVQPDGRCAGFVFADAHGVKCTLSAYPKQPLSCVGERS